MKKGFLQLFSLLAGIFLTMGLSAQTTELFFSEYSEPGGGNHKYLEIFNGTGAVVDLTNYAILTQSNGKAFWTGIHLFPAASTLSNNDVWVLANDGSDALIKAQADETFTYGQSGYITDFNGDDVRYLVKLVAGGTAGCDTATVFASDTVDYYVNYLDIIGRFDGVDPGSGWEVAGIANGTKDNTMIRKPDVLSPNTDWDAQAGTDSASSEWFVYSNVDPNFYWSNVGMHTANIPPPPKPKYQIGQVTSNDVNGEPDSIGVECWLEGVVMGYDLDGNAGISFTLYDGNGINVFNYADVNDYVAREGDKIAVLGAIAFYRGLTEIFADSIVVFDSNKVLPAPVVVSMLDETTESELIMIENLILVNPTQWPAAGSDANVDVTNGTDTFVVRIDKDSEIDGTMAPTFPFNLVGIGGQYDATSPYDEGYQVFPRTIADFQKIVLPPMYTIGQVTTVDANGEPDSMGVVCILQGVVVGIDLDGNAGLSFTMNDGDGINVFNFVDVDDYVVREGDKIAVAGAIAFYNGLTEIMADKIVLLDSNQTIPTPVLVTMLDESTESELIQLKGFMLVDSLQWPTDGNNANVDITNGTDTFVIRIDKDTEIDGTPAPTYKFDVIGIGGQFDGTSPYDEGYQIFPRTLADITMNVSVKENDFSAKFRMFPNPNNGQFVLENNSRNEVLISVINPLGETVYTSKTTQMLHNINLNEKASGIYFVRVNEVNGDGVYTGRVLVK